MRGVQIARRFGQELKLYYNGSLDNRKFEWEEVIDKEPFNRFSYVDRYPNEIPVLFEQYPEEEEYFKLIEDQLNTYGSSVIEGWMQDHRYFDEELGRQLFSPSQELLEKLRQKYEVTDNCLSIAVMKRHFLIEPLIDKEPLNRKVISEIEELGNTYDKIFLMSDDIDLIRKSYKDMPENVQYLDYDFETCLYLPSLCKDIMMSAEATSWWSVVLSDYKNKRVMFTVPYTTLGFGVTVNNYKFTF